MRYHPHSEVILWSAVSGAIISEGSGFSYVCSSLCDRLDSNFLSPLPSDFSSYQVRRSALLRSLNLSHPFLILLRGHSEQRYLLHMAS